MGFHNSRSGRIHVQDDQELPNPPASSNGEEDVIEFKYKVSDDGKKQEPEEKKKPRRKALKKVLSRVLSEDYETAVKKKKKRILLLNPRGAAFRRWNKIFLATCVVSLFVDPLFLLLPVLENDVCVDIDIPLQVNLTIIRTVADVFYVIHIYLKFHTAYIAPSSRVFGRGELVIDSSKISMRYLKKDFWVDFIAALPVAQVLVWLFIPSLTGKPLANKRNVLRFIIIFQYIPRIYQLICPLSQQIIKVTGVVIDKDWAGAAYNLLLFLLASHIFGASWYLLGIERTEACWRSVCHGSESSSCQSGYFDCSSIQDSGRESWFQSSNITTLCNPSSSYFLWGIYSPAVTYSVTSTPIVDKVFYCFWWGMGNLVCMGQNLIVSNYPGEVTFVILLGMTGLVLFASVFVYMQRYLQSTTIRLEEWRIRRIDTEQWMQLRQLPHELRQAIRRYDQYQWVATRGVDEEALLKGLPMDLRRDIKRHICLDLIRRVPLFDEMDGRMLDAICGRLKPALCTEGTFLVREGDPVKEMFFITCGQLDSYTTDGGRAGFFNSCCIGPGDFCGEELLTWALDPSPSIILPLSTRTVKSISEVEAFALIADDLKFVASQFRRLHSKQLRHKFRFYSHHWRTWAASFIQIAWRRYNKKRKAAAAAAAITAELRGNKDKIPAETESSSPLASTLSICVASFAATIRRTDKFSRSDSDVVTTLQKPPEPDFSIDDDEE